MSASLVNCIDTSLRTPTAYFTRNGPNIIIFLDKLAIRDICDQ